MTLTPCQDSDRMEAIEELAFRHNEWNDFKGNSWFAVFDRGGEYPKELNYSVGRPPPPYRGFVPPQASRTLRASSTSMRVSLH